MNRYPWYPTVCVLGPGGIKGFLELGALSRLNEEDFLSEVKTYVGVSVGAIIGLLIIVGYSPEDIVPEATKFDMFQDLNSIDTNKFQLETLISIAVTNMGLVSHSAMRSKLEFLVRDKMGMVPTLEQLYIAQGIKLVTVTLNLSLDRVEYVSYETEPNLSCVDAVLLSTNIPFLFQRLTYRSWTYVDGAFGNPYPIDLYDDGKTNILGLNISSSSNNISDLKMYGYKVIHSPMTQIKQRIIEKASKRCRHINLRSCVLDASGILVKEDDKAQMLKTGYAEASKFLDNLKNPSKSLEEDEEISFD